MGSRSADAEGTSFPTSGPSRAPRQGRLVQFWGPHSSWLLGLCLPGLAVGGEEVLRTGQIYDSAPTPPAVPLCFHSELWGRLCQSPSLNAPLGRLSSWFGDALRLPQVMGDVVRTHQRCRDGGPTGAQARGQRVLMIEGIELGNWKEQRFLWGLFVAPSG